MAGIQFYNNLELNGNQLLTAKAEVLASSPGTNQVEGRYYYDSTLKTLSFRDDSAWRVLVEKDATITLTNKSIDGDNNTISNLLITNFKAGEILSSITGTTSKGVTEAAVKNYVDNLLEGRKWGESVRVATTANGTLSTAFANGQTVDGVVLSTGDRILLKDQSTGTENGVYIVEASGAPTRDETEANLANSSFIVREGTTNGDTSWVCTNDTITYGSTSISFNQNGSGSVPDATTSTKGKVELATQAETETRTDTGRAVTPSGLANFPIKKTFDVGNNSDTSIALTHNLGTRDVAVFVYDQSSPYQQIHCDVQMTDTNTVTLIFAVAPGTDEFRAVILG